MQTDNLIPSAQFCEYHKIEFSFINSLSDYGLITLVSIEQVHYIPFDQITAIEKMIRLHYDLDINIEGIEAISHLLQRVDRMQQELGMLRNRLGIQDSRHTIQDGGWDKG